MATHTAMAQGNDANLRTALEQRVGISCFVASRERSWHGDARTRFTDFLVHEIDKDGNVVHLTDYHRNAREMTQSEAPQNGPKPDVSQEQAQKDSLETPAPVASAATEESKDDDSGSQIKTVGEADAAILSDFLGQQAAQDLIELDLKIQRDPKAIPRIHGKVTFPTMADRSKRSQLHSEVRRIFNSRVNTTTDGQGNITASAAGGAGQRSDNRDAHGRTNRERRPALGGKFLHFSLYKENKDSMEAVQLISRITKIQSKQFGIAGTKDRRAATVQRVSIPAKHPQALLAVNQDRVFGVRIGDFKFEDEGLWLGRHQGNQFTIVMKNCQFTATDDLSFDEKLETAKITVESTMQQVAQRGFINYFGTQRFGTHGIGTHEIGIKILKEDFEGAVKLLLSFDPSVLEEEETPFRRDDIGRTKALSQFNATGDFNTAVKNLPRKFNVEHTLMRHLGQHPKDFLSALKALSRSMRTMYSHAYQSLVWNSAVTKRWEVFGDKPVAGDLVLVSAEAVDTKMQDAEEDEENIHLAESGGPTDRAPSPKAHVLTAEEASSGSYTIFDVVLPLPGWNVQYPQNEIGQFYVDFMAKDGLDPHNMRRRQPDFNLPGDYRRMMGKFIGSPSVSVQAYCDDTEQLVPTDLDLIKARKAKDAQEQRSKVSQWHTFAATAQEQDRKRQAQAEAQNVGISQSQDVRINETWVETALDGSNKRVKVARHRAEPADTATGATDDTTPKPAPMDTTEDPTQGKHEGNQPETISAGITVAKQTFEQSQPSQPPQPSTEDTNAETDTVDTSMAIDGEKPADPEPTAATTASGAAAVGEKTDKIAVVLRFALHPSQYATIVLRELQGEGAISE